MLRVLGLSACSVGSACICQHGKGGAIITQLTRQINGAGRSPQRRKSLAIPGARLLDVNGIDRLIPAENKKLHFPFPNRLLPFAAGAKRYLSSCYRSRRANVLLGRLEDLHFGGVLREVMEFDRRLPHGLKLAVRDSSDAQVGRHKFAPARGRVLWKSRTRFRRPPGRGFPEK